MKKEIGNQMTGEIEGIWERLCEAWYGVAPYVLEVLHNSMQRRITKAWEMQQIID